MYVFASFLSMKHVAAYEQFGSFLVILLMFVRQGVTPKKLQLLHHCTFMMLFKLLKIIIKS